MDQNKGMIRKNILSQRAALNPDAIKEAEYFFLRKIISIEAYQRAETVMLYMDFKNEAPTSSIITDVISSGKRLVLPLTDKDFTIIPYEIPYHSGTILNSLLTSSFGILEPNPEICTVIDPKVIDLVIVPGVGFDKAGNRMGYGKGCYDRFLPFLRENALKIGLAYDFQVIESIPTHPYDVKMDFIISV